MVQDSQPYLPPTVPSNSSGEGQVPFPNLKGKDTREAWDTLSPIKYCLIYRKTGKPSNGTASAVSADAGSGSGTGSTPAGNTPPSGTATGQVTLTGNSMLIPATRGDVPKGTITRQETLPTEILAGKESVLFEYAPKRPVGLIVAAVVAALALLGAGLWFGVGDRATVPDLTAGNVAQANTQLADAHLLLGTTTEQPTSDPAQFGKVLSQTPAGKTKVKKDTKVNIVVADHPVNTTVPNIVGGTSAEAKALLEKTGLTVGKIVSQPDPSAAGVVLSQTPVAQASTPWGSTVDLVVSSGDDIVPNVVGQDITVAGPKLVEEGLVVTVVYTQKGTGTPGTVVAQNPAGGSRAPDGTAVTVTVLQKPSASPTPVPTKTVTQTPAPAPTVTVTQTPAPAPTKTVTQTATPAPAPTVTVTVTASPLPQQ